MIIYSIRYNLFNLFVPFYPLRTWRGGGGGGDGMSYEREEYARPKDFSMPLLHASSVYKQLTQYNDIFISIFFTCKKYWCSILNTLNKTKILIYTSRLRAKSLYPYPPPPGVFRFKSILSILFTKRTRSCINMNFYAVT